MSCWNSWIRNLTGHLSLIVQVARIIGVTDEQKRLMGVGSGLELVTLPHGHQLRQDLLERYTNLKINPMLHFVSHPWRCWFISWLYTETIKGSVFICLFLCLGFFAHLFFFNSLGTTKFISPQLYLLGLWLGESQCSEMKNVPYQLLHSIFCPLRRL